MSLIPDTCLPLLLLPLLSSSLALSHWHLPAPRLPVDSARKLRWYDKADLVSLTRQHVREKHLLLDTITALKKARGTSGGWWPVLHSALQHRMAWCGSAPSPPPYTHTTTHTYTLPSRHISTPPYAAAAVMVGCVRRS